MQLIALLLVSLVVSLVSVFYFCFFRKNKVVKTITSVDKLVIYPIKSLPGIEITSAYLTKYGLKWNNFYDRSYLLIDSKRNFVTLRTEPSLARLKTYFLYNQLCIDSPTQQTLKLDTETFDEDNKVVIEASVWGNKITGIDCGDKVAAWFQSYLKGPGYRLIKHTDQCSLRGTTMESNGALVYNYDRPIIYQDKTQLLIINDGSVKWLNERLAKDNHVSYRNFRPNIVVSNEPFAEDNWQKLEINEVMLSRMKPCTRCKITTLDPDTGRSSSEPLITLRKFRLAKSALGKQLYGSTPLFGVGFGLNAEGSIKVGDIIVAYCKCD